MKTPYSHAHVVGDYVFAARGGAIHSFSITSGGYVKTWEHPDVEKQALATQEQAAVAGGEAKTDVEMNDAPPASDEPPAKRQRVDENGDSKAKEGNGEEAAADAQGRPASTKKGKKAKNRGRAANIRAPSGNEKPLVAQICSTQDGKHVLAVSGHDKTLWVFEHDGEGRLQELSQRKMPKRPIDLALGPDDTIILADKFGDVYALPLLFDPLNPPAKITATTTSAPKTSKPSATTLTVHSKRNRVALEAQLQWYESQAKNGGSADAQDADTPAFEMALLLGHVSMLTAVLIGESEGKKYILTSDRDEHVRITRYLPQAHVIENFCLGHKEFISALVIPSARDQILVSGGGDADLFVWDWKTGTKLSTTSVLSLAQVIAPEITKVAVSSLSTLLYPTDGGVLTYVLAICEDIKAILAWQLTEDNQLNHPSAIQLPGNPLHLAVAPQPATPDSPPRIVVAIDPTTNEAKSLNIFTLTANEGRLASDECSFVADEALTAAEAEVTPEQVRALLYGTEQLRKQEFFGGDDEEPAEGELAVPAEVETGV